MFTKLRYANLSLFMQVLIPFILLLILLALGASAGSSRLLQQQLNESILLRLEHVQKLVYEDFKRQEQLLGEHLNKTRQSLHLPFKELQQYIYTLDRKARLITGDAQLNAIPILLKDLAHRSINRPAPVVSVIQEQTTQEHYLIACLWLPDQFLFLQRPLGRPYLDELNERFHSDFFLFDRAGELIATSSNPPPTLPELTSKELNKLHAGTPTAIHSQEDNGRLFSFAPLPLGDEGIYILGTSQSLEPITSLVKTHILYLLSIICLILIVGISIYWWLSIRIFSPINALLSASEQIINGERKLRVEIKSKNISKLDQCAVSCNQLLIELEDAQLQIEQAKKQNRTAEKIDLHNHQLRKINLELEKRNLNLKEQNQELSALFQVTQAMTSSLDQKLLFERIIQAIKGTLRCSRLLLFLHQPGSGRLTAAKKYGFQGSDFDSTQIDLGHGIVGEAAVNQQLVYCSDLSKEGEAPNYGHERLDSGSLLSVPMTIQNRLIGVIALHHNDTDAFNITTQQMAQAIANQAAIAIENARLYEKTKTLSATDELTSLANRRQFQEYLHRELAQSRRYHNNFSILMIDIDHFKLYNDWHGHLKGDAILKQLANLILKNTRGIDLAARFGGEEFVILLPKTEKEASLAVAEKLRLNVEKEIFPGAAKSQPAKRLTISIGAASFPEDSVNIYDLLNLAEDAAYQAKKQGRNRCVGWQSEAHSSQKESTLLRLPSQG